MQYYKSYGLIAPLNLNERYIVEVLGFDRNILKENCYSISLQQEILNEHLILENWFKKGIEFLKKKGVEGIDKVKDKAYEIKDGIKDYGKNFTGVVAALTAMVNDPDEFAKYKTIMTNSLKNWPERVAKGLAKISEQLGKYKMSIFTKALEIVKNGLVKAWKLVTNTKGWKGVLSLMAFGLAINWVDDEFEVERRIKHLKALFEEIGFARKEEDKKVKIKHVKNAYKNAKALASEDEDENEDEDRSTIKDWIMGGVKELEEGSETFKLVIDWLKEKFKFAEMLKEKIQLAIQNVAGKALEQMAGPIAWIKELIEMYEKSAWVLEGLAGMLSEPDDMTMEN